MEGAVDAEALLQRVWELRPNLGIGSGVLEAQAVLDALQASGEPWASVSLSRVRKACAKLNKDGRPYAGSSEPAPPAVPLPPAALPQHPSATTSASASVDLRAAYRSLRDREMRWLFALPVKYQAQMFDSDSTGSKFPANHIMHNGEIALLLAGAKPCVTFGHYLWKGFGRALAEEVRWAIRHPSCRPRPPSLFTRLCECAPFSHAIFVSLSPPRWSFLGWRSGAFARLSDSRSTSSPATRLRATTTVAATSGAAGCCSRSATRSRPRPAGCG